MTALLEKAMAAIQQLPADAQDAIAARLLAEVADEHAWAGRFEATTDAQWEKLGQGMRYASAEINGSCFEPKFGTNAVVKCSKVARLNAARFGASLSK